MFRISRVFETAAVVIVKVSGQIKDSDQAAWPAFLDSLRNETGRWVVLDFSEVTRIEPRATTTLLRRLPETVLLMNCPTDVRNVVESAGLTDQILDPNGRERCFLSLAAHGPAAVPGPRGVYGIAAA
jgi:hypothetical protein